MNMNLAVGGISEAEGSIVLTLSGRATIQHANEAKGTLYGALCSAERVVVDVSGVTEVDPAFFQLLCSAHRSATELGKRMGLEPACPELFRKAAEAAGFHPSGCGGEARGGCLLVKEEDR